MLLLPTADDHRIAPRPEGQDGRIAYPAVKGDRFHLQGVRKNRAAETEPLPQEPGQDLPGQGRRVVPVQRRVDDVSGHQGGDPRADRLPEGVDVAGDQRPARAADDGQDLVGVRFRVAVARKMLSDGKDVSGEGAAHEGDPEARDLFRVPGERPVPDHRVAGVAVDVEDGCEIDVDADRREFRGQNGARRFGGPRGVAAEQGIASRGGELGEAGVFQPRDPSSLLVDGDQRRRAMRPCGGADLPAQLLHLTGVFQVAGEEDDARCRPVPQPCGEPGGHRFPLESQHQERGRLYSFPDHPGSTLPRLARSLSISIAQKTAELASRQIARSFPPRGAVRKIP